MKRHKLLGFVCHLSITALLQQAYGQTNNPSWWSSPPPVAPPGTSNPPAPIAGTPLPLAVANVGQLKYMAYCATQALKTAKPALGAQVEAQLVGAGKPIPTWDKAVSNVQPFAPVNLGQLKAAAAPFYSILHTAYPPWVDAQLAANSTQIVGSPYPWTIESTDDKNNAIASVGQLKAVFSLRFEHIIDADNDFMMDPWELLHGFSSSNSSDAAGDTDNDGLLNLEEYRAGTNPHLSDTDSDGMPDYWEVLNGIKPSLADATEDPDGDGLSNLTEYLIDTKPRVLDTDGDGMPDGWEVTYSLDPLVKDGSADNDNDGWSNLDEFYMGTDPLFRDYDNDGLEDGWELQFFGDLSGLPTGDPDLDLFSNLEEFQNGTSPLVADINLGVLDPDGDGLTTYYEWANGLNPYDADTDGDGIPDGLDSAPLHVANNSFVPSSLLVISPLR